ncbi:MAG: alcohol dehydrogenase catalytic domain-containing protein [Clostridiales Family XIII bacterium]|jgi:2-desacetyl-2-hydroxyethyl bacteriochlorophyllide A dehydrogenase|nr:alcohol dehydrogenase catalytic domain-containing protein [Clostridiales Family XIII bacterium]
MKAAIIKTVGSIEICEAPTPVLNDGESLIRVIYIGICGTDVHLFNGNHPTAVYPLIPGHEFVGELVESKGRGSERFNIGDTVVAQELFTCGTCDACAKGEDNVCNELSIIGVHTDGGFAEYVKVMTHKMYRLPKDIDLKLAALTEPLAVAVHDVRVSGLNVGETVLVLGGGPIGLLIAVVARLNGAGRIVVSEVNEYRRKFASDMGFDTIDPASDGFDERLRDMTAGRGFDVSFEAAGAPSALSTCIDHTKNTGVIVIIAMTSNAVAVDTGKVFAKELTLKGVRLHSQYNFMGAVDIISGGALSSDLQKFITGIFPLDDVAEALETVRSGNNCFKILLEVK